MDSVRIVKVDAICHLDECENRYAIYSVDFQPKGGRLATGGGDMKVKIWSLPAILHIADDKSSLLATISAHSGHVHIVRWSRDGKWLASAGVDGLINISAFGVGLSGASFGMSKVGQNKENWVRILALQGHAADVLDIDWSPNGILASGSVDNSILIWDCAAAISDQAMSRSVVAPTRVLSGHCSYVKGLSFDPIGCYLTSCSEDGAILIWNCETWSVVRELPCAGQSSERTLFRRVSWAPDGKSFCITGTRKSMKPCGSIIKRDVWSTSADLIGHKVESMSCRFLPFVLAGESDSHQIQNHDRAICVVAMGDLDGVLSIWSSDCKRSLLVVRDLFESSIADISWTHSMNSFSSNGSCILGASSLDGYFCLVEFGNTLGPIMDDAALDEHFRRQYGRDRKDVHKSRPELVEDPLFVSYNDEVICKPSRELSDLQAPVNRTVDPVPLTAVDVLALQKQGTRSDGKKRIRPVLLEPEMVCASAPDLAHSSSGPDPPMLNQCVGAPEFEAKDSLAMRSGARTRTDSHDPIPDARFLDKGNVAVKKQRSANACFGDGGKSNVNSLTVVFRGDETIMELLPRRLPNSSGSSKALPLAVEVRRTDRLTEGLTRSIKLLVSSIDPPGSMSTVPTTINKLSMITLSSSDNVIWETYICSTITSICGVSVQHECLDRTQNIGGVVAVGTSDGSVSVLSLDNGARISPTVICGLPIAFLDARQTLSECGTKSLITVIACTSAGELWRWNLQATMHGFEFRCTLRCSLRPALQSMRCRSAYNCMQKGQGVDSTCSTSANLQDAAASVTVRVESVSLTENGKITVGLFSIGADGGDWQAFVFSEVSDCWMRVADLRHTMSRFFATKFRLGETNPSNIWDSLDFRGLQDQAVQRGGFDFASVIIAARSRAEPPRPDDIASSVSNDGKRVAVSSRQWMTLVSLCHLEEKLQIAFAFNVTAEIRSWLFEYVLFCAKCKLDDRVHALVNQMLLALEYEGRPEVKESIKILLREVVVPAIIKAGTLQVVMYKNYLNKLIHENNIIQPQIIAVRIN